MQQQQEGIIFNHMADENTQSTKKLTALEIMMFLAEESVMVMLMLSMLFLL
jgi:hypothetical protein